LDQVALQLRLRVSRVAAQDEDQPRLSPRCTVNGNAVRRIAKFNLELPIATPSQSDAHFDRPASRYSHRLTGHFCFSS
jgi:hypothetical protein